MHNCAYGDDAPSTTAARRTMPGRIVAARRFRGTDHAQQQRDRRCSRFNRRTISNHVSNKRETTQHGGEKSCLDAERARLKRDRMGSNGGSSENVTRQLHLS